MTSTLADAPGSEPVELPILVSLASLLEHLREPGSDQDGAACVHCQEQQDAYGPWND
jgi:hypothetical protein